MTIKTFYATQLFDGEQFKRQQCVQVDNGVIVDVYDGQPQQADIQLSGTLVPGFIDVQVNGGGGSLFNNQPDLACLRTMSQAHQQFGTTAMLPTVITDSFETMSSAGHAVAQALELNVPGIIGIHYEGPHLSEPKKGIHPQQHLRSISDQELALFTRKDLGKVCITLAPETLPVDVIAELTKAGVIICLGHSNATSEQVIAAIDAGARGFTHLYNAMSPLTGRETGMVGIALLDEHTYCGLIVDHYHVAKHSCQLAIKCKGAKHIMLVTDAMSHVGSDQTHLHFAGMDIVKSGNKLTIEGGRLAGSTLDMASAVRNTVGGLGQPLQNALTMASFAPARFLSLDNQLGKIQPGFQADWVMLDDNQHCTATWIKGQPVYDPSQQIEFQQ